VDTISGATISSGAVVNGVNTAGYFVQELLNPSAPLNLPEDQQFGGVLPGATTKQEEKAPDGIDELYSSDAGCVVYVTGNGRNGPIQVQVGVAHSGQVAGIYIDPAKHSETEGLGDAIENSYFLNRFLGKSAPFTVGENIDAISGATISSTAVIDCVNRAVEAATPFLDPSKAEDISSWFAGVDAGDLPAIVAERKAEVVQTGSGVTLLTAKDWETEYPEIYASYMRNGENDEVVDYVKEYPMIGTLFEGYGFAKYYGSARGHAYVIEDVTSTGRPHAMANCFTCKTPNFTALANEMGDAAYSLPFEDVLQDVNEPLSCYNCHGNNAPTLTLTHTYLADAMGEDLENVDARNLVCAQCHVDYYFHPETKATTLPYANLEGIHPDEMLAYYNSYLVDGKPYADYVNPRTGVRQIMVNHPEMETFLSEGSVHRDKFTCADCHMGTATAADGTTYKNHMLTSPLDNEDLLANTCSQCHSDLKSEVAAIQEEAERRTYAIGYELELLTEKLAAAVESGDYTEQELDAIRSLARDGQFYWNFVFVENSEGAHNSKLTTYCLNKSEELVNQALGMFK
jgi:nitrite reductase (cytochrome c-552)